MMREKQDLAGPMVIAGGLFILSSGELLMFPWWWGVTLLGTMCVWVGIMWLLPEDL